MPVQARVRAAQRRGLARRTAGKPPVRAASARREGAGVVRREAT